MGIPQSEDAKKTKGVNVIQGVIPLELKQIPPLMVTLMTTSRKNGSPNVVTGQNDEQSTGKTSQADLVDAKEKFTNGKGTTQNFESNPKSWRQLREGFDLVAAESPVTNV